MPGPGLVLVVPIVVAVLIAVAGGRSLRGGGSTAGHHDPNAIEGCTLDRRRMDTGGG